jgi:hypothetical protein
MHNPGASRRGIEATHLLGWLKKNAAGGAKTAHVHFRYIGPSA